MGDRTPVNEAEKPPSGGRTYRGRASGCPRRFAGFVSLRGGICQPNLRRGRRLVNGKVESTNGKKEFTEGKPVNVHVHSRDSCAHEATLARAVGSAWRKTLYVVGSNAFRRKKNHTLREQIWQGRNQGMGRCPPSGGRTYRGRAGECPRTFAGFVGLRGGLRPRRANGLAKYIVRRLHKCFSTERPVPPREQIWQGRGDFRRF